MYQPEPTPEDPVERARLLDALMWSQPHRSAEHRHARDAAVREAVEGGVTPHRIAEALRVHVADVERMAANALPGPLPPLAAV